MDRFDFARDSFDLLVIGGGISGACVAYEAASRGLSVLVVEKNDFGAATSAATSKLIHGGLRYLNTLEFGLVRESLHERRILEDIAPNLVVPLPFLIPTYSGQASRIVLKAGMVLYDLLSFDRKWARHKSGRIPGHRTLSREEVLERARFLNPEKLTGGFEYFDCQSVFPERLTLAFIKSAVRAGASAANYAEVTGFLRDGNRIQGASIKDAISGKAHNVRAQLVVNSGGPWAGKLLDRAQGSPSSHAVRMSEGIHLILPDMGLTHALVLATPGHRHFFLIPWKNRTLAGTTDREYNGSPDDYRVSAESVDDFIKEINAALGRELLNRSSVLAAYGGLRPLTDTQTQGTYSSSRRYEIFDGAREGLPGLITVEGGKYTTSRHLAETVLETARPHLNKEVRASHTQDMPLYGCDIYSTTEFFAQAPGRWPDFPLKTVMQLARNYGTEMDNVLSLARRHDELREECGENGEILAQAAYAVESEMALSVADVVFRRTGIGSSGRIAREKLRRAAEITAARLGRDGAWMDDELRSTERRLRLPWEREGEE